MEMRRTRAKRIKYEPQYQLEPESSESESQGNEDDLRKSRIRDSNKEFAKRMTILQAWSDYWSDYTVREGEAYPKKEARAIVKKAKKISCPIPSCRKSFTTVGGLRYHYARCNIERCFKCKVCNPSAEHKTRGDLLRHMVRTHYSQLPELDKDQKEIAHAYLSTSGRIDKSKARNFHGDKEAQINCKTIIQSFVDLNHRAFASEAYANRPFKTWQTLCRDWELLTYEIDRRRYYPPEKQSVKFKCAPQKSWSTLDVGGSMYFSSASSSSSSVFYTGGINTASAWLPKPMNDKESATTPDLIAISVNCCSMDRSLLYKDSKDVTGCIQFWSIKTRCKSAARGNSSIDSSMEPRLSFMVGHSFGNIFEMAWCPLGASYESPSHYDKNKAEAHTLPQIGLLAIACGDGQIRILSVPHPDWLLSRSVTRHSVNVIEATHIYRVRPIATLMPPGVGPSTDYQTPACTAVHWNVDDNQRLIAAGYANGNVAVFDLANFSPILYSEAEHRYNYQPLKTWLAHGMPITGVAILSSKFENTLVATGSRDRLLKVWNLLDLNSLVLADRAPITKILWDFRLRGVVMATEAAFTSFQNRVSYRFPTVEGTGSITVSAHRATVWGLGGSMVTSSLATSDEAGEVLISLHGRPVQKRERNHQNTHSLYSLLPRDLERPCIIDVGNSLVESQTDIASANDGNGPQKSNSLAVVSRDLSQEQLSTGERGDNDSNIDSQQIEDDYRFAERPIANKPEKFLLPIDHRAVESYTDFRNNFGLEFVDYNCALPRDNQKLPESCQRAGNMADIYCDRVCDYPFSAIKQVAWSPNITSFPCLLSVSQIGLCRLDRLQILERMFKGYIEAD